MAMTRREPRFLVSPVRSRFAFDRDEGVDDGEASSLEINIAPTDTEHFAAPHPGETRVALPSSGLRDPGLTSLPTVTLFWTLTKRGIASVTCLDVRLRAADTMWPLMKCGQASAVRPVPSECC